MGIQEWRISGPENVIWTPEEITRIVEAAKAFQAALPGVHWANVRLDGVTILYEGEEDRLAQERVRYGKDG